MARTVPFRFTPNTTADADQVNADFDAVVGFFGDIRDSDCSVAMDFDGNKISASAGKRVPETRIENNAASSRVVASDPNAPGNDLLRAISGDHIKGLTSAAVARIIPGGSINGGMLATGAAVTNIGAATLGLDKLKVTVHAVPFSVVGVTSSWILQTTSPTITFPKATYELLAIYVKTLSGGTNPTAFGEATDAGTNWNGFVAIRHDAGAATITGSLVYVFISKV